MGTCRTFANGIELSEVFVEVDDIGHETLLDDELCFTKECLAFFGLVVIGLLNI